MVRRLGEVIQKTASKHKWQNLIIYWFWCWRTSSSFRIYLFWDFRSRFTSCLIYSALSSESEVIRECSMIFWSRCEILLLSVWSASSCMSIYNLHDFESEEEYIRSQTLSSTMNRKFQKWYTAAEEIHAQEHKNLLSKYSSKLQNQQAFPMIEWVRSNHDQVH